jgi:hypothetical protein
MSQAATLPAPAALDRAPVGSLVERPLGAAVVGWSALWRSRLLVWLAGGSAFLALGTASGAVRAFDPSRISLSFGSLGNALAAPAVRWDSVWYLQIADHGYKSAREASFYPLYPILVRAGSWLTGSLVVAGLLISFGAMFVGLALVHRLAALELGPRVARTTVDLIAFGPMALFLSAVYTESLFLALTAGTFYAARRGRWATAGALGGLAALSRVTGVLLLVPVLLIFFYGPRGDATPIAAAKRWRPRYRWSWSICWAALIPAGAGVFSLYMAAKGYGAAATVHAQQAYSAHQLVGPFVGLWDGAVAAWHEIRLEFTGVSPSTYSSQALLQFGALAIALVALAGTLRRLPLAYGAYAALGLLVPLSSPTTGDPLRGLDRYASVLFPLFMWAAAWAIERRASRQLLLVSGALLAFFSAQFATWHWVGTPLL